MRPASAAELRVRAPRRVAAGGEPRPPHPAPHRRGGRHAHLRPARGPRARRPDLRPRAPGGAHPRGGRARGRSAPLDPEPARGARPHRPARDLGARGPRADRRPAGRAARGRRRPSPARRSAPAGGRRSRPAPGTRISGPPPRISSRWAWERSRSVAPGVRAPPGWAPRGGTPPRGVPEHMKALTWHGTSDVRVDDVPDPTIQDPTDAIIRVTSSGLCGSDLHLYTVMGPFLGEGDILGHEPMGVVEAVGPGRARAEGRRPGRRPVQHLLRRLLHVQPGPAVPVRDDPGPRVRDGRLAVRLHEALRPGPGRPGRAPARPVRRQAADQRAGRARGRPLPLPLRRAPDGVAGRRVRRGAGRRHARRPRARPDRRHGHPHRRATAATA